MFFGFKSMFISIIFGFFSSVWIDFGWVRLMSGRIVRFGNRDSDIRVR